MNGFGSNLYRPRWICWSRVSCRYSETVPHGSASPLLLYPLPSSVSFGINNNNLGFLFISFRSKKEKGEYILWEKTLPSPLQLLLLLRFLMLFLKGTYWKSPFIFVFALSFSDRQFLFFFNFWVSWCDNIYSLFSFLFFFHFEDLWRSLG